MLAFKNNKIILKGTRNRNDGLWDIPIPKATITTSCCPSPTTHAGVYNKRNSTTVSSTPTPLQHKNIANSIPAHLQQLSELASSNDLDNAILEQLKVDNNTTVFKQDFNTPVLKANIILRKKQTHLELATFLHACCFSPPISIFKMTIKIGF